MQFHVTSNRREKDHLVVGWRNEDGCLTVVSVVEHNHLLIGLSAVMVDLHEQGAVQIGVRNTRDPSKTTLYPRLPNNAIEIVDILEGIYDDKTDWTYEATWEAMLCRCG